MLLERCSTRINSYIWIYVLIIKCSILGGSWIKSLMGQSGPLCSDKSEGECWTLLVAWPSPAHHHSYQGTVSLVLSGILLPANTSAHQSLFFFWRITALMINYIDIIAYCNCTIQFHLDSNKHVTEYKFWPQW